MAIIKKAPNDSDPLSSPNHNTVHGAIVTAYEDGWFDDQDETWTYASASTFTITGVNKTAKYYVGVKLRWKQGGGYKYGVVASSAFSTDTTVTIIVNTDYTIANSAITDNWSSTVEGPLNFPAWFNWSPTFYKNDNTTTYTWTSLVARYTLIGKLATVMLYCDTASAAPGFNSYFTLPITALGSTSNILLAGYARVTGTGFGSNGSAMYCMLSDAYSLARCRLNNQDAVSMGTTLAIITTFSYEIA
jgi:hypothetical protein